MKSSNGLESKNKHASAWDAIVKNEGFELESVGLDLTKFRHFVKKIKSLAFS